MKCESCEERPATKETDDMVNLCDECFEEAKHAMPEAAPMSPEPPQQDWPTGWQFSMSPWGYTVTVRRTEFTETCVRYRCNFEGKCNFEVAVDPRDMTPESARQLL